MKHCKHSRRLGASLGSLVLLAVSAGVQAGELCVIKTPSFGLDLAS